MRFAEQIEPDRACTGPCRGLGSYRDQKRGFERLTVSRQLSDEFAREAVRMDAKRAMKHVVGDDTEPEIPFEQRWMWGLANFFSPTIERVCADCGGTGQRVT